MLHGVGFQNPNVYRDGKLICREEFRDKLAYMRELTEVLEAEAWELYHQRVEARAEELGVPEAEVTDIAPPVRAGLPCPFAGAFRVPNCELSQGAISRLTPAIKTVFGCVTDSDDLDGHGYAWDIPRIQGHDNEPSQTAAVRLWAMRKQNTIGSAQRLGAVSPPTDVAAPACRRPR